MQSVTQLADKKKQFKLKYIINKMLERKSTKELAWQF